MWQYGSVFNYNYNEKQAEKKSRLIYPVYVLILFTVISEIICLQAGGRPLQVNNSVQ
jgi:hypothetical protein